MEGLASSVGAIAVRRFELRDLTQVLRIEREAFREYAYGTWTFLSHALRDRHSFYIAEGDGSQVLGFVLARRSGGWFLRRRGGITSIAVSADCRGQGIGTLLFTRALESLREFGAEEITLEVHADNKAAFSLYSKFGFRHREWLPDYYGPGQAGIRMVLKTR